MKILILNYYYPPLVDAHAYRWEQVARHWAGMGLDVEVITGSVAGAPTCAREEGVKVVRTGLVRRPAKPLCEPSSASSPAGRVIRRFVNLVRPFYRKLYWPDASWHWFPLALREVLRSRKTHYDIVVSYYPCMAAPLAAYALRRLASHRNFLWIVDYGDPFSTSPTMPPNNYALYGRLNRFIERKVAEAADYVVFTNHATGELHATAVKNRGNTLVIPHLVDVGRLYAGGAWLPKANGAPVTLCYVGGFHKGIREPGRLFDLMRHLNVWGGRSYKLNIFGPLNTFSQIDLSPPDCPAITYFGPIERSHAIEILKSADAVINVDNENCTMTASKIVECIATGRPVINITGDGERYPPLSKYEQMGYAFSVSEHEITANVAEKARVFLEMTLDAGTAPLAVVQEALRSHSLETVANAYLELLRRSSQDTEPKHG